MIPTQQSKKNKLHSAQSQLQEYSLSENGPSVLAGGAVTSTPEHRLHKNIQSAKQKYSSRMRKVAPHVTTISQTYHYRSGDSPVIESARERNNIASQQSRARKKLYMNLLEKQITNLELELHQTTNEIEMIRTEIFNALMHTDQVNTKNAQIQSHILRKLKGLLHSYQENQSVSKRTIETEINICLDSCLYRIGASGSERKAILDILYKGMINRNLPNIYRYILWCAVNKTHLFRKLNRSDRSSQNQSREIWWNEIKDVGEKVIQSNEAFLEERGQPLSEKAKEILKCSRQILHQKQQIQNYGQGYDTMIKALRQNLTPVQFAQLFLFVEGSIHKKQLQMFGDSEDIQHATLRKLQANQMAQGSEQSQRKLRVGQSTQGQAAISMREGQLLEIGGSGRKRQKPNEQ